MALKKFHIINLGTFEGASAAAIAVNCTFSQFEYRWYKLGMRSKEQFASANLPARKNQKKSEISLINKALNNWSRPLCADQELSF